MAEMKTKVSDASVEGFLSTVEDEQERQDCFEIVKIMEQVTAEALPFGGRRQPGRGGFLSCGHAVSGPARGADHI